MRILRLQMQMAEVSEQQKSKGDADGESGYYVTLASDMVNGTYTFTMLLQGKNLYTGVYI